MIGIVGEGRYSVRCDYCVHGHFVTEVKNFMDAQATAVLHGWTAERDRKGDWCHRCPDCK